MRIGTVALDAVGSPAAALTPPVSVRPVDLVAQLSAGLRTTVWRWASRLLGRLVRDVLSAVRARGPALLALVPTPRMWPGSAHLATATTGGIRPQVAGESTDAAPRLPTQRLSSVPTRRVSEEPTPAGGGSSVGTQRAGEPSAPARPEPVRRFELALPADPTAPKRARVLLHDAVQTWGVDDEAYQDAAMVVTELVANAVDHARTDSTLTLELVDDGMRVAVRDMRPGRALRARPVDPTAPRGRGLQMIEALAVAWGVTQDIGGKTVWAVLPRR